MCCVFVVCMHLKRFYYAYNSTIAASPKGPKSYEALDTKGSRKKTKQWTDHSLQAPTIEGPPMKQDNLTGHSSPAMAPEQDPARLSFTFNDESSTKDSSSGIVVRNCLRNLTGSQSSVIVKKMSPYVNIQQCWTCPP